MTTPDIDWLANLLRDTAKAEILPRFRHLDAGMVKQKSEAIDLVTEADEEAERRIKAEMTRAYPDVLFVGEESVAADESLLDALDEAELAVVVDPVDGTANFAAGLPLFAVMASVVRKGETIAGIIYDPMGDDWVKRAVAPSSAAPTALSGSCRWRRPRRSTRWSARYRLRSCRRNTSRKFSATWRKSASPRTTGWPGMTIGRLPAGTPTLSCSTS
jgi:3'-phosphoadenosine 5'-phosphosulfate (PAPS) 3'-phosphatase